jgi:O-antigen/teichoic acid export membrane protein
MQILRSIWTNSRIRKETGWVVFHKLVEFVATFVLLKILTNLLTKEMFGEYNVVLTAFWLLSYLSTVPVQEAYQRRYHTIGEEGTSRSALAFTLRFFVLVPVGVLFLTAALTLPLAPVLQLERWSILCLGLVFLTGAWRVLWTGQLNVRRRRRGEALQTLSFTLLSAGLSWLVLRQAGPSATAALLCVAAAGGVTGLFGAWRLTRELRSAPAGPPANMPGHVLRFGIPLGALLTCQWILTFTERYILGIRLDYQSVGQYVGAYQVCGVPFMLLYAMMNALVLPIAYQRARDVSDPRQLWFADRVLLISVALYVGVGVPMVLMYAGVGPWLVKLLTRADYVLPTYVLVCIAAERFLNCLALLLATFFKVHQRTLALLVFNAVGAALVIPLSWLFIGWYGVLGAALGVLLTGAICNTLVVFAPGGCLSLVRQARAACAGASPAPPDASGSPDQAI